MDNAARLLAILTAFQSTVVIDKGTPANTPTGNGVSVANGYTYDLPAEHVYVPAQQDILNNTQDPSVYPKIVFAVDGGGLSTLPSRRVIRRARLSVMVIIQEPNLDVPALADKQQIPGWRPVSQSVMDLKDDIERAILLNQTLGGLVDTCVPSDFETDSNFSYPDGVIVVWANVTYYND